MEGNDENLPLFHGNKIEDPKKYQFLCEAVWTVKQTMDDEVKKGQLVMTLWGHALDWLMKFVQVPMRAPVRTLAEVRK